MYDGRQSALQVIWSSYAEALICQYGWPLLARENFEEGWTYNMSSKRWVNNWNPTGIAVDALVAVTVVLAAGALCEWFIRRRREAYRP